MPKEKPKNGYYYFMLDYRQRHERNGRRFHGGMTEVSELASPEWRDLPQQEKDRYNEMAKERKYSCDRRNVPTKAKPLEKKYNSFGKCLADVEREKQEEEEKEIQIREFVSAFVRSKHIENLKSDEMFLVHVNYFCKTDDDEYYPAELALCKFSILKGVIGTYHTFFDPGEIKKGYMFALKEQSDRSHKITLSFVQSDRKYRDYSATYNEIIKFLEFGKHNSVPLFTMYDDVFHNTSLTAVEKTFETLWSSKHSTGEDVDGWKKYFPVYPLPLLFTELHNYCHSQLGRVETPFPNSSTATQELNKEALYFSDDYACDFHQKEEKWAFCSKSYVQRWAQIICEHCRQALDIKAEPVDHVEVKFEPIEMDTESSFSTAYDYDDVKVERDDDRESIDCGASMVSGTSYRTARTNVTHDQIGFLGDPGQPSSSVSEPLRPGGAWGRGRGFGRGRARVATAMPLDDDNFPALGGIARGVRNMRLNPR